MAALDDGRYDVVVVDIEEVSENDAARLEMTITSGELKGEVVQLRVANLDRDPLSLLGLPATLTVADGRPSMSFE